MREEREEGQEGGGGARARGVRRDGGARPGQQRGWGGRGEAIEGGRGRRNKEPGQDSIQRRDHKIDLELHGCDWCVLGCRVEGSF